MVAGSGAPWTTRAVIWSVSGTLLEGTASDCASTVSEPPIRTVVPVPT